MHTMWANSILILFATEKLVHKTGVLTYKIWRKKNQIENFFFVVIKELNLNFIVFCSRLYSSFGFNKHTIFTTRAVTHFVFNSLTTCDMNLLRKVEICVKCTWGICVRCTLAQFHYRTLQFCKLSII